MPTSGGRIRRPHLVVALAVVLILAAAAVVFALRAGADEPPPDFGSRAEPSPAASASAPPAKDSSSLPRLSGSPSKDPGSATAEPARLRIDGVDLDAVVRPVGVDKDGLAAIPENPAEAGWYRFGPAPGEDGSAVLMGHVDDDTGALGALAKLNDVEDGDTVTVARKGAEDVKYTITARQVYDKDELPAELFRRDGEPVLTLITCAAPYERDNGGYQNNLVVTATPAAGGEG